MIMLPHNRTNISADMMGMIRYSQRGTSEFLLPGLGLGFSEEKDATLPVMMVSMPGGGEELEAADEELCRCWPTVSVDNIVPVTRKEVNTLEEMEVGVGRFVG